MVFEIITPKMVEEILEDFEYYDKYGILPEDKIRIDITISQEALNKLKGTNRSKIINDLILNKK